MHIESWLPYAEVVNENDNFGDMIPTELEGIEKGLQGDELMAYVCEKADLRPDMDEGNYRRTLHYPATNGIRLFSCSYATYSPSAPTSSRK